MSLTTDPDALPGALETAAASLLVSLPGLASIGAAHRVTGPQDLTDLGPASHAIVAGLRGDIPGTVTVIVAEPVAAALCGGPLGAMDLVAAMDGPVHELAEALGSALGGPVGLEAPYTLDGTLAASGAVSGAIAVDLLGTDTPLAVVMLTIGERSTGAFPLPAIDNGQEVGAKPAGSSVASLDLLADVELAVVAELGRSRMTLRHLLGLTVGSVVELDRSADSAVDLFVNGTLIARGEVVVIDDEFGVRVSEIVHRSTKH